MTPPVAIALAYGIVWAGILLYLRRLRARLRSAAEAPTEAGTAPAVRETLRVR